ncbi:biotin--[acetyl-CoA-carboxylase] ligase [Bacteroidia bacterium]|nr:biotin--[acetyl-CoA-carboxylase] ligase [Bacteroidia bacterium]
MIPEIIKVKSTPSTNQCLRELAKQQCLKEGTVLYAVEQTAGRGQTGNHWEAEPGKNITCSMLFSPIFLPVKKHFLLSEATALGVKQALEMEFGLKYISIKWPNDIYYRDRKLAGILIENEIQEGIIIQSIVGIGLNVNQEVFTSGAPNPVSLKRALRKEEDIDLKFLLRRLAEQVDDWYQKLRSGNYKTVAQSYFDAQSRRRGFHTYKDANGETFQGRIKQISDDGLLHLYILGGGTRTYAFKEVSYILPHLPFQTRSQKWVYF